MNMEASQTQIAIVIQNMHSEVNILVNTLLSWVDSEKNNTSTSVENTCVILWFDEWYDW